MVDGYTNEEGTTFGQKELTVQWRKMIQWEAMGGTASPHGTVWQEWKDGMLSS